VARGPLAGLGRAVHALAWTWRSRESGLTGAREALIGAADGVAFEALRALGEGLAGRDSASRVAGARRALALQPVYEEAALALSRLLVDAGTFEEARRALARVPSGSPFARDARFLDGVALRPGGTEADVLLPSSSQASAAAPATGRCAAASGSRLRRLGFLRQRRRSRPRGTV
jgi:hypothetical protein